MKNHPDGQSRVPGNARLGVTVRFLCVWGFLMLSFGFPLFPNKRVVFPSLRSFVSAFGSNTTTVPDKLRIGRSSENLMM